MWARGFFDIDLQDVRCPDLTDADFPSKGYSRREMESWIEDLRIVQRGSGPQGVPLVWPGSGTAQQRLAKTYRKFYSEGDSDVVKVDWVRDHYEITNGRHRIWLARKAGLDRIPARVEAPDRETLARLEARGDRSRERGRPAWEQESWSRASEQARERER